MSSFQRLLNQLSLFITEKEMKTLNFLDVGCGNGTVMMHAEVYFKSVSGIEPGNSFHVAVKNGKLNNFPQTVSNNLIENVSSFMDEFGVDIHFVYDFCAGMEEKARAHLRGLIASSNSVMYVVTCYQKAKRKLIVDTWNKIGFDHLFTSKIKIHKSKCTLTSHAFKKR
jgi:hypothetical protein